MENPTPTIIVLIGSAMRIGIPIFITLIVIFILRRVDARWKAEAEALPPQPAEIEVEKVACWEVNDCSPEQIKECPAPASTNPCWQVRRQKNGYLMEKCLSCEIFQQAPLPHHVPAAHPHTSHI
jgi:hypothetical protein